MNGENPRTERPVPGVCPSLPGYGFSDKPAAPEWGIERISDAWCELMARLGYRRFGAQGSDWGTSIATSIGQRQPDRVAGIHLMPPLAPPDPATVDDLIGAERAALATLREAWESLRQVNEWISGSAGAPVTVPTGCSVFPKELQRPSRRWAERRFPNIRYWNEPGKGGHFAAFEPALFVDEVRSFFRLVR
ncbi:alpha/beta fold hydrolase [Amycolatopsis halotolerans]|uniref:Alpha/beta fold hydrolase n=1 Tax=Amycolatopsis halotolerans TaxID=330083 RepID=A0ABV7QV35_9PSEU